MNILGLHYGHDGSACVVKDGKLVSALSSERLSKNKKDHGLYDSVIDLVLHEAGITPQEVDVIGLSDYHPMFTRDTIQVKRGGHVIDCQWQSIFDDECPEFDAIFREKRIPAYHISHHLAHCAAAFYTSPFNEARCMSCDSSGGKMKANSVTAYGIGNKLYAKECYGLMVGCAYGFFTERLGIGSQIHKAGSTMGLAAYKQPNVQDIERHVNNSFFNEESLYHEWMARLWLELAGTNDSFNPADSDNERSQQIAANIQHIFEESVVEAAKRIDRRDCENLCLGGGSFLNCNANSAILARSGFKNLHLFPACGDDGCAVGTALYLAHHKFDEPRYNYMDNEICYLGPSRPPLGDADLGEVAEAIANGAAVAWCNGRSEYGPRALGNRSLLLDPRVACNRERVNSSIKNREWFRPLAPAVLQGHGFFEMPQRSPFMLLTGHALQDQTPAVVHVDGTSRAQTVHHMQNTDFYSLIWAFYQLTGVPCLLNTSLNRNGQPIVETDEDALELFREQPIDMLVLRGVIHRQ